MCKVRQTVQSVQTAQVVHSILRFDLKWNKVNSCPGLQINLSFLGEKNATVSYRQSAYL